MVRYRQLVALAVLSLIVSAASPSQSFAQATKLAIASVNGGLPITAGTPFSVVVVSQTAGGLLDTVAAPTGVTLSVTTGTSTLSGTLTGTIPAGKDTVIYSGLTYTKAENIVLTATRTSGDPLTPGSSGSITVNPAIAAKILVETAATGGGTTVPSQNVTSGTSVTMYAVTRDQYDNFVANAAADSWSLASTSGGVAGTDLVPSGDRKSAVFTGHFIGSAIVQAVLGALPVTPTGTLTVIAASPSKVRVETAADGSGIVVPAQSIGAGSSLTVYAITRDASNNFVANVAADIWSLQSITGGVVTSDLVPGGDSKSAVFTGHSTGSAQIQATSGGLSTILSGTITVAAGTATQVRVETKADGSGTVVSAQSLASGSSITVYAISRDGGGNFIANVAADAWSVQNTSGGVTSSDLAPSGNRKNALFTGHLAGTGQIRATSGSLTPVLSGTLTVTAGTATQVRVETQPDGNGTVVPAQSIGAGGSITVYAITRDALGNFVGNVAADAWSLQSMTGGVTTGDLVASGDKKSATFTGHAAGSAHIHATSGSLGTVSSGTLTVTAGSATLVRVETKADGSGTVVPAQSIAAGSSVTMYAVTRDGVGNFVANVAADAWSLQSVAGGVVTGDLVASGDKKSATFTAHAAGSAQVQATSGSLSPVPSGTLTATAGTATRVQVETQADGSGTVIPAQTVPSGNTVTMYAITRDASGNFVANVAADAWALQSVTGGVAVGDLIASGDRKSATFTGHLTGSAKVQATSGALSTVQSGILTVTAGGASQIRVETRADGSGTVVPAQSLVAGGSVTMYAITRDASGNFLANVAADTWTLQSVTGGVVAGDLVASGDRKNATFTAHRTGSATVRAASGSLTSVLSGTITVTVGAAANLAMISGNSQTARILTQLNPFSVRVTDASGNPVPGVTVDFAIASFPSLATTQSLSAASGVTDASGQAGTTLTLGQKIGTYTVNASSGSLTGSPQTFTATATTGLPANLILVSGNTQTGPINTALANPFVVEVTDAGSNPVAGDTVRFAITTAPGGASGQSLSTTVGVTGANGRTSSILTAGDKVGQYVVNATRVGLTGSPVSFDAAVSAGPAATIALVSGNNQIGPVGTPLSTMTVLVTDAGGNPVSGTTVTYAITEIPAGAVGTSLSAASPATASDGTASSQLTLGSLAGQYTVQASVTGLSGSPVTFIATAVPGSPGRIRISQLPALDQIAGHPFTPSPVVRVEDANGNLISTDQDSVSALLSLGSGRLLGQTTVKASGGIATFTSLYDTLAGQIRLRFFRSGLLPDSTGVITIAPDTAYRLLITAQPPAALPAGDTLKPPLNVQLTDRYGNAVPRGGVTVAITADQGPGGVIGTTLQSTNASGLAAFPDLRVTVAGLYRLHAVSPGLVDALTSFFTVTPAPADTLIFTSNPSNGTAGAVFATSPVVELRDRFGNVRTGLSAAVTLALTVPAGATLKGALTVRSDSATGRATFPGLSVDKTGSYTLSATAPGVPRGGVSASFTIGAAAPVRLAFQVQPTTAIAGARIQPSVVVAVQDTFGNAAATAAVPVTLSLANGVFPSGPPTRLTSAGVAVFDSVIITAAGAGKQLLATSPGLTGAASALFLVRPAAASRLLFTTQPGNSTAGVPFPSQPVVTIQDQYGNAATGTPQTVTIALRDTATRGASLLGSVKSVPVDTTTGRAPFTGLAVDKSGRGYTLTAFGSSVAPVPGTVVSDTFNISPAAANKIRVETAATGLGTLLGRQNVSSGTSITVYAVARDQYDNFVGNIAADTWGLTIFSGGVVPGDLVAAADKKSAAFTGHVVGKARITLAASGLTPVPSDTLTVVQAGAAAKIVVETADNGTGQLVPAQRLKSGRSLRVYAIARDAADNFIRNVAATWSVLKASGGFADSDLVAGADRKSALFTGHKTGSGRIAADSGGLAGVRSDTITVTPGTVARLQPLASTTPQTAGVRTPFTVPLAAQVQDSSDNPVPSVLVRFAAPVSGPSGTFAGRPDTSVFANSAGVATAPAFTANELAGSYTDSAIVRGAVPALFNLTNGSGAVAFFTITSVSGGTIGTQYSHVPFDLALVARDSLGNKVDGFTGTVDLTSNGTLVTGGGTTAAFTAGSLDSWPVAFGSTGRFTITARLTGGSLSGHSDTITVVNPAPTVTSLNPTNGRAGQKLDVVVRGTGFISGVTVVVVSDAHISSSTTVNSLTQLTATLSIDSTIVPGPKDVTIANLPPGGGTAVLQNGFIVGNNPVPTLIAIAPDHAQRFETLSVGLTGTNFLPGSTTVNFGPGITVNSATVDSGTHITASITISSSAVLGARQVVVVNGPPGGGTSQGVTFTVQQEAIAPPALASPANGASGQALVTTLQWNAPVGGTVQSYHLQVSTLPRFDTALVVDTASIPGRSTSWQVQGLTPYMAYYWRVSATQQGGAPSAYTAPWTFTTIPTAFSAAANVAFPTYSTPDQYQTSDYRMVGLPGSDNSPLTRFLGGTEGVDWEAYWDNGAASSYLVKYSAGDPAFKFTGGRAFWMLVRGPWSVNASVASALPDTDGVLRIPLHAGWNLITNPFPFAIAWSQVQHANGDIITPIFAYDGTGMAKASSFAPYAGYYFDNDSSGLRDTAHLVIPYGAALLARSALARAGASTPADSSWSVDIALEREGVPGDRAAWFGAAPGASEGRDRRDLRKPRTLGTMEQIVFNRPDWDKSSSTFASDVRPMIREIERWPVQVKVPGKTLQRLSHAVRFTGVAGVPAQFAVYLIDEAHATYHDLRANPVYPFVPAGEITPFTIVVGDLAAVQKELERVLPKSFALDQNYPNPFNPTTTIAVNVPYTAPVTVTVYNILGEEIRTVQAGVLQPGRYLFRWDGNNNRGSLVGTGVYLCRMSVPSGPSFVRKMLFLK